MSGTVRRAALVVSLLAGLVVAVAGALGAERVALAALGLGLLAVVTTSYLRSRAELRRSRASEARILRALRSIDRHQRSAADSAAARSKKHTAAIRRSRQAAGSSADAITGLRSIVEASSRQVAATQQRTVRLATAIEQLPSHTVNLGRLQGLLVEDARPLPVLGGWAATVSTIELLLDEILFGSHPQTVVECGSGTSTAWIAAALRARGEGHVYAIEHDPHYARQTTENLARLGLGEFATVLTAPLTARTGPGQATQWYDEVPLQQIEAVDLLLVDGPPGHSGPDARLPALEVFASRLSPGAIIVLDDTDRPEERQIVERWLQEPPDGVHLERLRVVERATVLRTTS